MILTKESKKKLKTFPKFPNTGCLNEVLQAARFKCKIKVTPENQPQNMKNETSNDQDECQSKTCLSTID